MRKWILPFIIALVIAFKSIPGGIFFLTIVWLMRRDPGVYTKSIPAPSDKDKKTAKRIYTWLLLSSFISVPIFLILVGISYGEPSNDLVLAALMPSIIHVVLFSGLNSSSAFVFRHTQQAILLVALRAGMAALAVNIGSYPEDGIGLFLLGNGSLWLFGSLWGRNQAIRGDCWWIKQKGEIIVRTIEQLERFSAQENLEFGRRLIPYNQEVSTTHALMAFRRGDPNIKKQAVELLDKLGQVEIF